MQTPLLHTPLIHPRVWGKRLPTAAVPAEHAQALANWAAAIRDKSIFKRKETELRGAFLEQFFVGILGYTQFGSASECTLLTEQRAGVGSMDAALGHFSAAANTILAPFEIKGPDTRNLDAIMPGRYKSPVTQAWEYALDTPSTQLIIVSNMLEIRVYAMGRGRQAYERFDLLDVADSAREYWRFMAVLAAPALLAGDVQTLLADSASTERDITQQLYLEYKTLRLQTIIALHQANGGEPGQYITLAQKILDRVLFIAFCEDRGLLPEKSLDDVVKSRSRYNPLPIWNNFQGLFRFIDIGNASDPLISAYNGGLFALDPQLDGLKLPDDACKALAALGKYDFASDVPVTVLGHIFEQSIDDLEKLQALVDVGQFGLDQLRAQLQTKPTSGSGVVGQRKTHGIVYTPDFITRFMVQHTVGTLLDERQASVRAGFEQGNAYRPASKQELKDYKTLVLDPTRIVEYLFWQAWYAELKNFKICDPACGSGAFLIAAFEVLEPAYQAVNEATQSITGSFDLFDTDRDILTGNLYGVDLNSESIEITQLSLWLKTAKRGKKLENLNHTLKVGNSIIGAVGDGARYSDKAFDWQAAFPEVAAQGGFDAVIGNPPYVRMEVLKPVKPYLEAHYTVASDRADLYAYFFEQGVRLLKDGGVLGYISSSTFFKTGSGEPLRRYLSTQSSLQTVVDFGDLQVFEGVTTYPAIVVARKQAAIDGAALRFLKLTDILPKDLGAFFDLHAQAMPQSSLQTSGWQFEDSAAAALRRKLTEGRCTLKELYGSPLRGIITGLNEAFVLSQAQYDDIVSADPNCAAVLKPFLEGKDLKKWRVEPQHQWLIYTPKNSIDIDDYPSIKAHLLPFKAKLEARATKQTWFELQQAQEAYQTRMEVGKIIYGHFAETPIFSVNTDGSLSNDKSYTIAAADYFLAALLNSKLLWRITKSLTPAVRGGYHELRAQYIETLPIPTATEAQRNQLATLAQQAQTAAQQRRDVLKAFGHQVLRDLAPGKATAKLPTALHDTIPPFDEFTVLIKERFKKELTLSQRNDWEAALNTARAAVTEHSRNIVTAEKAIDAIVFTLFELTPAEIALIEA